MTADDASMKEETEAPANGGGGGYGRDGRGKGSEAPSLEAAPPPREFDISMICSSLIWL
jgi:hypothetical protein